MSIVYFFIFLKKGFGSKPLLVTTKFWWEHYGFAVKSQNAV